MEEIVFKRKVEVSTNTIEIKFLYEGEHYVGPIASKVASKLRVPFTKARNSIGEAYEEFETQIRRRYPDTYIGELRIATTGFESIDDAKKFIKYVTKTFEATIGRAVKELKEEAERENLDRLVKEWLIEDYTIRI